MDKKTITISYDQNWLISIISSLLIHGLIFSLFIYQRDRLAEIFLPDRPTKILVDLELIDDQEIDTPSQVIDKKNLMGKGKLNYTKNSEQHLVGKTVPKAPNTSQPSKTTIELKESANKKGQEVQLQKKTFSRLKVVEENDSKVSPQENQHTQTNPVKKSQPLGIVTKNSLKHQFWFSEDDDLQINTETSRNINLYHELSGILKQRFQLYVRSGGRVNFAYVKKDEVSVLATIDKTGTLNYKESLRQSHYQPYLNYLIMQIVDRPPKTITQLPQGFLTNDEPELGFVFSISYSGQPLQQWWMGFNFINLEID